MASGIIPDTFERLWRLTPEQLARARQHLLDKLAGVPDDRESLAIKWGVKLALETIEREIASREKRAGR